MKKIKKILYYAVLGFLIWAVLSFLYSRLFFLNISVKFDDLEPVSKRMKVYYKGFEIGSTGKLKPDSSYNSTHLKLKIKPRNINLPENVSAELHTASGKPYINIIYPDSPSLKRLKPDSIISGKYQKDLNSILNEAVNGKNMQDIMGSASMLMTNTNTAVISLTKLLDEITGILKDIRPSLKTAAENLEKTSGRIKSASGKLDKSLDKKRLENSINSIDAAAGNIKNITENIENITSEIDKKSMPALNSILCRIDSTAANTEEVSEEITEAAKKRSGIFKMFLGKKKKKLKNKSADTDAP